MSFLGFLLLFLLSHSFCFAEQRTLWTVNERESGRILRERRLLQHDFSNAKYRALKSPSLFEFGKKALTSLKDGDFVSFDIPTSKVSSTARRRNSQTPEDITKHCQLSSSIPGVPSSVSVKTPSLKLFTCKPKELEEFHFVFDTSVASGGMWGTYFSADGHTYFIDQAFNNSDTYLVYDSRELVLAANQNETSVEPLHETVFSTDNYDISTDIENIGRKLSLEEREERRRQLQVGQPNAFIFKLVILTSNEVSIQLQRRTLSQMTSLLIEIVTRLNGLLVREVGVFFELTENFQNAICLDFEGTCGEIFNTIANRPFTRDQLEALGIPPSTYDLGQFIHTSGTGGQANLKALCNPNEAVRAGGATDFRPFSGSIDTFILNQFAHEVGHQMGTGHSWRDCINFQRQFFEETGVEPGGGTTIMGFHGVCGGQTNLANAADPYYNSLALQEARRDVERQVRDRDCGVIQRINRERSTLTVPESCSVPLGNNFRLKGSSSGSNGFYSWERVDLGVELLTENEKGRFRSYKPTPATDRFFPNLHFLNFELFPRFELLPSIERQMEFRFTERRLYDTDAATSTFSNAVVGDFVFENVFVDFVDSGEFSVSVPSDGSSIPVNEGVSVSWSSGGLNSVASDGKVQIFFGTHTMNPVSNDFLFDSERDLEIIDWELVGEGDITAERACIFITRNVTSGNGMLLIQANTNTAAGAQVNDEHGCFVFDLITGLSLIEGSGQQECDPNEVIQTPPPTPKPTPSTPPPTQPPTDPTQPPSNPTQPPTQPPTNPTPFPTVPTSSSPTTSPSFFVVNGPDPGDNSSPQENNVGGSGMGPGGKTILVLLSLVGVGTLFAVVYYRRRKQEENKSNSDSFDFDDIVGPTLGVSSAVMSQNPAKRSKPKEQKVPKKRSSLRVPKKRKTSLSMQDFGGGRRISVKRETEIKEESLPSTSDDGEETTRLSFFKNKARTLGRSLQSRLRKSQKFEDQIEDDDIQVTSNEDLRNRLMQLNYAAKQEQRQVKPKETPAEEKPKQSSFSSFTKTMQRNASKLMEKTRAGSTSTEKGAPKQNSTLSRRFDQMKSKIDLTKAREAVLSTGKSVSERVRAWSAGAQSEDENPNEVISTPHRLFQQQQQQPHRVTEASVRVQSALKRERRDISKQPNKDKENDDNKKKEESEVRPSFAALRARFEKM